MDPPAVHADRDPRSYAEYGLALPMPFCDGSPQNPTYNGQMVISEKLQQTRTDGSAVGFGKDAYNIPDVPHAMRLSASGTFLHGNYWGNPSHR